MSTYSLTINIEAILGTNYEVAERENIPFLKKLYGCQVVIVDAQSELTIWGYSPLPIISQKYAKGRRMVVLTYSGKISIGIQECMIYISDRYANLYPAKRPEYTENFEVEEYRGTYGNMVVMKLTPLSLNRLMALASNSNVREGYVRVIIPENKQPVNTENKNISLRFSPTENNKFNIYIA